MLACLSSANSVRVSARNSKFRATSSPIERSKRGNRIDYYPCRYTCTYTSPYSRNTFHRVFKDSGILCPGTLPPFLLPVVPRLEILSSANFYAKRGVRDGKKTVEERGSFSWETRAVIAGEREQRAYSLALIPFDLYLLFLPSLSPFEF